MDFSKVKKSLEDFGYDVKEFQTSVEAKEYLCNEIKDTTVGFGGSQTLEAMGLFEELSKHNQVTYHNMKPDDLTVAEARLKANQSDVYLSSVNAISETGEMINIDGTGNRVASLSYGHKKVYLVIGENKIEPDFKQAYDRARNIAGPLNAKRLKLNTPCAKYDGLKCFDCKSPDRICRMFHVLTMKPKGMDYEVILIHEKLGY